MPEQGRALAAPALFLPAPSTPEDTGGDLPGSAFLFPRRAAGRGGSTLAPAASVQLPFSPGSARGPLGRGGAGPAAPSPLSLHRNQRGAPRPLRSPEAEGEEWAGAPGPGPGVGVGADHPPPPPCWPRAPQEPGVRGFRPGQNPAPVCSHPRGQGSCGGRPAPQRAWGPPDRGGPGASPPQGRVGEHPSLARGSGRPAAGLAAAPLPPDRRPGSYLQRPPPPRQGPHDRLAAPRAPRGRRELRSGSAFGPGGGRGCPGVSEPGPPARPRFPRSARRPAPPSGRRRHCSPAAKGRCRSPAGRLGPAQNAAVGSHGAGSPQADLAGSSFINAEWLPPAPSPKKITEPLQASVAAAHGPQSSGSVVLGLSCPGACGIFPNQGSNLCPLHWQVNSSPLDQERSLCSTVECSRGHVTCSVTTD
ncbi:basic proline-rich protein-like [Cervus canadensis]|uniref:basic proline-rich protein-like n=1 Tax=Cervus canadensis TaxID=1574408 RepID=UPI001C9E7E16|nr:basic proline-rich protein-like [Cervus canadensis]